MIHFSKSFEGIHEEPPPPFPLYPWLVENPKGEAMRF